jgi:hypothetical protein
VSFRNESLLVLIALLQDNMKLEKTDSMEKRGIGNLGQNQAQMHILWTVQVQVRV